MATEIILATGSTAVDPGIDRHRRNRSSGQGAALFPGWRQLPASSEIKISDSSRFLLLCPFRALPSFV